MERLLVGDEYLAMEDDEMALLKYYVIKESKMVEGMEGRQVSYGLEIEKWTKHDVEKEAIYDVTIQKDKAFTMMDSIKESKVLPVHLKDVVVDMLC